MASFTLDIDDFAAIVGFLNAKKIVGMDERLFASISEPNLPQIMAKLKANGWAKPADRPGTWHFNEDLFQTLATAVAPHFVILGRSKTTPKSIFFYVADKEFVQIVVTSQQVVVTNIANENMLAACLVSFLNGLWPAEIIVARVRKDAFDAGRVARVDDHGVVHARVRGAASEAELPWNEASIAAFVRGSMGELVRT